MIKGFFMLIVACYALGQGLGAILGILPFWPFTGDQIALALFFPGAVLYLIYGIKKMERGEPITEKTGTGWVAALGVTAALDGIEEARRNRRRSGKW